MVLCLQKQIRFYFSLRNTRQTEEQNTASSKTFVSFGLVIVKLLLTLLSTTKTVSVALANNDNVVSPDDNEGESEPKKNFRFSFVYHNRICDAVI